jgi:hypothetical protein
MDEKKTKGRPKGNSNLWVMHIESSNPFDITSLRKQMCCITQVLTLISRSYPITFRHRFKNILTCGIT